MPFSNLDISIFIVYLHSIILLYKNFLYTFPKTACWQVCPFVHSDFAILDPLYLPNQQMIIM